MKTFLEKYYGFLVGAKVVSVSIRREGREEWPQIVVEKGGERFTLEVSRDEEGNGPGFLFGLPVPK